MADRSTIGDVQGLLGDDFQAGRSLAIFLRTASRVVDRVIACLAKRSPRLTLDTEEAQLMEAWLAAHAYTRSDTTWASRSTLSASGSKHGQTGMDLDASFYGQQAKALDPSGSCLIAIMKGQRATAAWLGRVPSDQTDYVDRS